MKSRRFGDIFTEEQKMEIDRERKLKWEEFRGRKDYQIGLLLGEIIWLEKMPSLSTDACCSRNVIQVSKEDTKKVEGLGDKWYKNQTKENWVEYQLYRQEIDEKYFPKEFIYYNPYLFEINNEFKEGIINGLWNTDGCGYSLNKDDIEITQDDYFTIIKFVYRKSEIVYHEK